MGKYCTEGKFELGRIHATQHIIGQHMALALNGNEPELWAEFYKECLYNRHWQGDFGDVPEMLSNWNQKYIEDGEGVLFSAYRIPAQLKDILKTVEEQIYIETALHDHHAANTIISFPSDDVEEKL